jgi:RHS repeat-associated protein
MALPILPSPSSDLRQQRPALQALNALSALAALSAQAQIPPPAMTWQYGYDAMGRLHTVVDPNANTSHIVYDNITAQGAQTLAYSDRGRLASVTNAGGTTTYLYNGLEQRASKSGGLVPTGQAHYVYDEAGRLLGEYDANGVPLYETIYLNGLPVGVLKQTGSAANADLSVQLYNLHADHIATARLITRQDHTIVWRWDTAEAFGGTPADENPSGLGAFSYHQRFPGQVFDAESGLLQNWHREYNARLGRYMQSDPIGLLGGINTFAYANANPLSYVDPDGRLAFLLPAAPIAITAADVAIGATIAGGAFVLDRMFSSGRPPGFWDGEKGAAEWGRRNGIGAKGGKDLFHDIKRGNRRKPGSRANDNCSVNPDTGEILDGQGDHLGDLNLGR